MLKYKYEEGITKVLLDTKLDTHYLLIGGTGIARKTTAMLRFAQEYYEMGYKIISLFDIKNTLDFARCQIPPYQKFQLKNLKRQGETPKTIPCEIYHPLTLNIPNKKIIPMEFYTIPIKNLSEVEIQFLLGTKDAIANKMVQDVRDQLTYSDNFYTFIHKIYENIKRKKTRIKGVSVEQPDLQSFGLRIPPAGDRKNVRDIVSAFKIFGTNYDKPILMPQNYPLNINWKSIFNNQKTITIFTDKYIRNTDLKLRYFLILNRLVQIRENLNQAKYPLLILFDEVKYLIKKFPIGYEEILTEEMKKFLSIVRSSDESKGVSTVSCTTDINIQEDLKEIFTEILWGKLAGTGKQLERITKALAMTSIEKENLRFLKDGRWLIKGRESDNALTFLLPRFAIPDSKMSFTQLYEQYYPDRMQNYTQLIKNVREEIREWQNQILEQTRKEMQKEAQYTLWEKQQQRRTTNKEEFTQIKKELQQQKNKRNEEIDKKIIELIFQRKGEKEPSNRKIAEETFSSHSKVNRIAKILQLFTEGKREEEIIQQLPEEPPDKIKRIILMATEWQNQKKITPTEQLNVEMA